MNSKPPLILSCCPLICQLEAGLQPLYSFYAASQMADKKVGSEIFPGSAGGKSSHRVTNFIIATD